MRLSAPAFGLIGDGAKKAILRTQPPPPGPNAGVRTDLGGSGPLFRLQAEAIKLVTPFGDSGRGDMAS